MASFKIFDFIFIRNRREIEDDEGNKFLDLSEPLVNFTKQLQVAQQPIEVTAEFEGRPDLIARAVYGTEDAMDLMLYFNGISNPLMVQRGMFITVFDFDSMKANIKNPQNEDANNLSKQNFSNKISKQDKNRIKALQDKQREGGAPTEDDFRTPTMTKPGTEQTTPVDGRIVLGTNVTDERCKDNVSATQSLSEEIRKAVKDKVVNAQKKALEGEGSNKVKLSKRPKDISGNLTARPRTVDTQVKKSEFKKRGNTSNF